MNPDRLLPGEDPAVVDRAHIAHWATIYEELLAAKQALTACITEEQTTRSEEARRELEEFDLTIIKAQQARFQRRLNYWHSRADPSERAGGEWEDMDRER